jgi:hypothetical protein
MRKFTFVLFLLFLCFFSSFGQINLSNGLVAHYTFNGNASDQSGYNNNPTSNNAILTNNRFCESNSAYRFRGYFNQNRMDIPASSSLTFNDTLSFSGFVKINNWEGMDNNGGYSSNNGFHPIFAKSHDRSGLWCSIIKNLDSLVIYIGNNIFDYGVSKFQIRTAVKGNYLSRWMQIGVVISKNQLKVYLDGNKIKTANVAVDMSITNSKPLHLGMYGDTWSGWYPLNGELDDIRFYKRLLSDAEMKALFQEGETGRVVTSIQSGKWEEGTTWDCGRLPTILSQTIIQNGHIVNLSKTNSTKYLTLIGILDFKIGGNLITSQ